MSHDLSSIPAIHVVEGEHQLCKVFSELHMQATVTHPLIEDTHTLSLCINKQTNLVKKNPVLCCSAHL